MYYMFGFLFLVFLILIITCSEATILLCYFHLCAEVSIVCLLSCRHAFTCAFMRLSCGAGLLQILTWKRRVDFYQPIVG